MIHFKEEPRINSDEKFNHLTKTPSKRFQSIHSDNGGCKPKSYVAPYFSGNMKVDIPTLLKSQNTTTQKSDEMMNLIASFHNSEKLNKLKESIIQINEKRSNSPESQKKSYDSKDEWNWDWRLYKYSDLKWSDRILLVKVLLNHFAPHLKNESLKHIIFKTDNGDQYKISISDQIMDQS